jgi:hypothetical protein
MEKSNWFDTDLGAALEKASAEQALELVAKTPKIVKAVKDALSAHDTNSKKPGWVGPSRSQVVRNAIATILQAD